MQQTYFWGVEMENVKVSQTFLFLRSTRTTIPIFRSEIRRMFNRLVISPDYERAAIFLSGVAESYEFMKFRLDRLTYDLWET